MQIGDVFDELNDGYTDKIQRWVPYYKKLCTSIVDNLPKDFYPHQILDLGCGNGNISALTIQRFPNASHVLVDASQQMIIDCKARFPQVINIFYQQNYFQELEFERASFDLITAGLSLHHLKGYEKQAFFKKIYFWLRSDGCFSCSDLMVDKDDEPLHSSYLADWKEIAESNQTTPEEWQYIMEHYETYDHPNGIDKQIAWLKDAGFENPGYTWKINGWTNLLAQKK